MKTLLKLVCVAVIMFGASGAASWYWKEKHNAGSTTSSSDECATDGKPSEEDESSDKAAPESPPPSPSRRAAADSSGRKSNATESAAPMSNPYNATADETVQFASTLRERMLAVRERENQLSQRQAQIELILKDIRSERAAIEELRKQVNEEFKATEEHLAAAEQQKTQIEAQSQSLQDRVTELDTVEREGTKRLAGVYDGMASDKAAKILEHMVNSGNMDTAVKVLGVMKERQAAKVLGEFDDTSMAAQLSERLKGLKKPVANPKG